ncbi:EKC/KEOPS complex subunit TPRKB [Erpetoichthys calabaricus]|uniref:EKC/KEOPS complex subunit TPRKB n=1 Tax=Erpetoichthys calabaricus TaxID=27687 RepID=A0A8C4RVT1_ERPCA|nr:EKC/KEOPS complex subunit TPRKB [Erpetoichthys calabaricus]XP_051791142.1 EKC/KEOPS complex subunit TPRKB [Erpetoichthys calabaricus]
MMHFTQDLELFPNCSVTLLLFKEVQNAAELRKKAMEGLINGALIKSTMIVDAFQVMVATNKAVHLQKLGKMKTRTLYSEIIFNLSPTNNISEAFKKIGISDGDSSVLIVLINEKNTNVDRITSQVDGIQIHIDNLQTMADTTTIRKLFKITPQEEKIGTLLDAIVCRLSTKDVC